MSKRLTFDDGSEVRDFYSATPSSMPLLYRLLEASYLHLPVDSITLNDAAHRVYFRVMQWTAEFLNEDTESYVTAHPWK